MKPNLVSVGSLNSSHIGKLVYISPHNYEPVQLRSVHHYRDRVIVYAGQNVDDQRHFDLSSSDWLEIAEEVDVKLTAGEIQLIVDNLPDRCKESTVVKKLKGIIDG